MSDPGQAAREAYVGGLVFAAILTALPTALMPVYPFNPEDGGRVKFGTRTYRIRVEQEGE